VPLHESAAVGFARVVDTYERGRPSYPAEAVDLLVGPGGADELAVDVGAGTGKFTRLLAARRSRVVAVEPVAAMRAELARHAPSARAVAGTAEALPLAGGVAGLVTVAQAFHWFAHHRALAELHRVLRPGGRLGLIWNAWDERAPWERAVREIRDRHRGDAPQYDTGRWRDAFDGQSWFGLRHERHVGHVHELTPDDAVARIASTSYIAALAPAEHERVRAEVRAMLPTPAGCGTIPVAYRTHVVWCERR
jgi:SAM-dependent methyltransferase